jgi:hypothetical protein
MKGQAEAWGFIFTFCRFLSEFTEARAWKKPKG